MDNDKLKMGIEEAINNLIQDAWIVDRVSYSDGYFYHVDGKVVSIEVTVEDE